ncbi:hypothetical protein PUN4_180130 [Paraburkholderia unamae]|uniref:hypothetical protein n=1 Tax=Paraburkholderia unamae TaxID=219649 RepID=UPI001CB4EC50|nr:hypothetical protein [Paraburkholderia unamae]CAG9252233.1 hypothetical protein PUN4_180130 [Paraburkholderia unamae]
MTAPQKLYGLTLKPHVKTPHKLTEVPTAEARPDLMEAVRRAVAENQQAGEWRPPEKFDLSNANASFRAEPSLSTAISQQPG